MSQTIRSALALTLVAAMLAPLARSAPAARAAEESCFPETGFCIRGDFLAYWNASGGLAINGYPLTDQRLEALEDGMAYTVQYLERVRLEYHPENPAPNTILLGQFGRRIHPADPPVGPSGDGTFYAETGHNIGGAFLAYWRGHGGLAQFGYPLTEQIRETLEDGKPYTVQYFERARFERHPENAAPYNVLLGQFGRRILAAATPLSLAPCAADNLATQANPDAGAGQRNATIALTNTGAAACALAGVPGVQLPDANGRPLDTAAQSDEGAPVGIVALPPGSLATFNLRWGNWCGVDPGAVAIRVTMPGGGGQFTTGGIGTPPCLGVDQPSTLGIAAFRLDGSAIGANVVLRYYAAINARDYRAAYNLLSPALQAQQGPDPFAAGYGDTQRVAVTIGEIGGGSGPDTFRVAVRLVSSQTDGSTRRFIGTYAVAMTDGAYAIVGAAIAPES